MKNTSIIVLMLVCIVALNGCAGVTQGRPTRANYQDKIASSLIQKYSANDSIVFDQSMITMQQRNQAIDDLIFLTDVNYHKFEEELYAGKAFFDTSGDLAILGLGAAGGLITHGATQAILAAISGGIGGARVSIDKNFFHEFSTQALIAKMQSSRKAKLAIIREATTLEISDYSLSRGLSDIADYYNAGTIMGALQDIVADAGQQKKTADDDLKVVLDTQRDRTFLDKASISRLAPIRAKIKTLTDAEAISLNHTPPTKDPNAENSVTEADTKNQRFVNGNAARQALLLRASHDVRSDQNLSAWEKSLKLP